MNKICLTLITCLISNLVNGQQSYFQQKVNTKINVELDGEQFNVSLSDHIVVPGTLVIFCFNLVKLLNNEDFPQFGFPTRTILKGLFSIN